MANYKTHLLVCGGTGCKASQSQEIVRNLKTVLADKGLSE
ncbi:MAG: (2Fe-2S) ferredoxin domain-containing protein, partial [Bacteroidales bacterium]